MKSISQYLLALTNAQSLEELWNMHTRAMAGYGFDRMLYGLTNFRTSTSLGDPADFILLSNHPKPYIERFIGENLYFDAPMTQWALNHEGCCSWSRLERMIADGSLTDAQRRVVEFNRSMQVFAGYSISFRAVSSRAKGAIGLAARPDLTQSQVDATWARHGTDILLMNNVAHLKITSLPYAPPERKLTARQREVLEWVGDGKTTQDIAILMGLSRAMVEKHLRLARQALGVETTAQAVLKATLLHQMYVF
jgi:LuxR family transcriptional regulator